MIELLVSWLLHPVTWIEVLLIGMVGEVFKQLILGSKASRPKDGFRGWRGVYAVTYRLHAVVAGLGLALFSLYVVRLPTSAGLDSDGGHIAFHVGNGALAMVAYAGVIGTIKAFFNTYAKKWLSKLAGTAGEKAEPKDEEEDE